MVALSRFVPIIQQPYDVVNTSSPVAFSQTNAARAEGVKRHLALLGALVHRFNGLEGKLEAQGGSALAVGLVFTFPG